MLVDWESLSSPMDLVTQMNTLEPVNKPRSLRLLDQAYDASSFKFSQIIRYLQDQYSYHQELNVDPYDTSTSPLPVDPKLAYDIHTGRYMRKFKTQGANIVTNPTQNVVRLPYPPQNINKLTSIPAEVLRQQTQSNDNVQLPKTTSNSRSLATYTDMLRSTSTAELKSSRNSLRRKVWRLPSHVAAFTNGRYKQPLKLPPITVSKLMNGIWQCLFYIVVSVYMCIWYLSNPLFFILWC